VPYYDQDGITIYNADCRDILPLLPRVDLVLTDPPYGIGAIFKGSFCGGWAKQGGQAEKRNEWDAVAPQGVVDMICQEFNKSNIVIWGGNYFNLPASRRWLVWNKPRRNFTLSDAELAWTNQDALVRVFDGPAYEMDAQHPTQKPIKLMTWCLSFFPDAQTILDPFMGSGTTLVAAKLLGKKAIGIELEEKYCQIAVERLAQGNLFGAGEEVKW
jgi:site-specific DNA-methyltransferase (adenine-specific)